MKLSKQPRIYFIIPQILFYTLLSLFLVAATLAILAILFVIVDDSQLREKILKVECIVLIVQGVSAVVVLFRALFQVRRTKSEGGEIFMHSLKVSLRKHISPFKTIQQRYQQVLISRFKLKRSDKSVAMDVSFSDADLAIWDDLGKREIENRYLNLSRNEISTIQDHLDQILITGDRNEYQYDNKCYTFRYASGGALPIVTIGKTQYYCLIFREVPPVGWNIANGGCDSQDEMLKPANTIIRELNEELIIFDPVLKEWYFFEKFHDLPDHNTVRRHLLGRFPAGVIEEFSKKDALTYLQEGPDTLNLTIEKESVCGVNEFRSAEKGFFININAYDYGIEFDKIAHIAVGKDAIFVDGEPLLFSPQFPMVNAPIGLFKKSDLDASVLRGSRVFIPDFFFWDAQRRPRNLVINERGCPQEGVDKKTIKDDLEWCIEQFLIPKRANMPNSLREFNRIRAEDKDGIYDFCPVTRSIIKRIYR